MNGPSIFIAKTYEILEVISILFRAVHTQMSLLGMNREQALLF